MPELPEVETVIRGISPEVLGRTITGTQVYWSRTIHEMPPDVFSGRIRGQKFQEAGRRGKYMVFTLTDDCLMIHLRMTGRLYVADPLDTFHADQWLRVVLQLNDGRELRFSDSRKFGRFYLAASSDEILQDRLGPEPIDPYFTLDQFKERIASRSGVIKSLLLNQAFIAGVGNIYADEALWKSCIDPRRHADTLEEDEIERLFESLQRALLDGIQHEGASINWYRKPDGTKGESQDHFNAYGRDGMPCSRCGTPISKITIGQRGTHFCPVCQH